MGERFDLVVIGAGPGGYVAAVKAAKEGLRTAIVEERRVGGTCLNRGCIPAKAMIHASSLYREMKEGERFGVLASEISYDYGKILAYKEETTDKLCQGVEQLLFRLKEEPKSLVIIGGGVISVEFASVYADLGCKVTIVEALSRLVPNMDKEISQNLKMI